MRIMIRTQFHARSDARRRGESLPVRLRFASRHGVTLVELMISMLILAIVCIAWLQIIGIQSARKEARRREAVERLVGVMDAFMYVNKNVRLSPGFYFMNIIGGELSFSKDELNSVRPIFDDDVSPIGYQLQVCAKSGLPYQSLFWGWDPLPRASAPQWLVGRLYNSSGLVSDLGKPFFSVPVCLGL